MAGTRKKSNPTTTTKPLSTTNENDKSKLEKVDKVMNGIYDTPEVFVGSSDKIKNDMTKLVTDLYQVAKKNTDTTGVETDALDELVVKGFDNEQIWAQIQLYNDPILSHLDNQINELNLDKDLTLIDNNTSSKKRSIQYDDDEDLDGLEDDEDDEDLDGSLEEDDEDIDEGTFDDLQDDYQESDEDGDLQDDDEDDDLQDDYQEDDEDEEEEEQDKKINKKQQQQQQLKSTKSSSKDNIDFFDAKEMEKFLDDADEDEYQLREEQEDDEHDFELGDSDDEDGGIVFPEGKYDKQEQELDKLLDKIMEKEGIPLQKSQGKSVDPSKMKFDDFFSNPDEEGDDEDQDEFGFEHDDYEEDDEDIEQDDDDLDGEDEEEVDEQEDDVKQDEQPTLSPEEMTAFQKRASRIQDKIKELELQNLKKKDWTMIGEASSKERPEGSLLTEHLDYEHTQRATPLVTEQTNRSLEDIIKKRILEKNFDDVIRKTEKEFKDNYKKKVELNDEKSAEGLASIYEKDYMKQVMGVEETDELKAKHVKIYEYFNKLCYKLDSLTNFQHTPKRIKNKELNITTASALNMEDKVPVAASTATMIAPEEVYFKKHADEKGESELTSEERKKNRKAIKGKWRSDKDEKDASDRIKEKTDPNFVKKNSTAKALAHLSQSRNTTIVTSTDNKTSKYTKSGDFFSKLQTEQENKKKGIEDPSSAKSRKKAKMDQLHSQNFKL